MQNMQVRDDAIRQNVCVNFSCAFTVKITTCIKKYTQSHPLELFYNLLKTTGKPSPCTTKKIIDLLNHELKIILHRGYHMAARRFEFEYS